MGGSSSSLTLMRYGQSLGDHRTLHPIFIPLVCKFGSLGQRGALLMVGEPECLPGLGDRRAVALGLCAGVGQSSLSCFVIE